MTDNEKSRGHSRSGPESRDPRGLACHFAGRTLSLSLSLLLSLTAMVSVENKSISESGRVTFSSGEGGRGGGEQRGAVISGDAARIADNSMSHSRHA